jgi:hypothetical protein
MQQIVPFHGCSFLVPSWNEERNEWHFSCALPSGEPCHKTIKKRKPSSACFTDEYEVSHHG